MVEAFSFCRIPPRSIPLGSLDSPVLYRSKATYDSLTRAITITVWIAVLAAASLIVFRLPEASARTGQAALLVIIVVLGVLLAPLPFSPRSYELTTSGIVVRRMLRSFEIPYTEISRAERVKWRAWRGIRLYASGGLYGYFGLFKLKDLGNVWVYVKNRHNVILVKTHGGASYMLSPENPKEFLEKLNAIITRMKA